MKANPFGSNAITQPVESPTGDIIKDLGHNMLNRYRDIGKAKVVDDQEKVTMYYEEVLQQLNDVNNFIFLAVLEIAALEARIRVLTKVNEEIEKTLPLGSFKKEYIKLIHRGS